MRYRFLGRTGLKVSELCLGTANFGATGVYARSGNISQKEADKIVGEALDSGINFFNTAERYSYGLSEQVFGKALGVRRQEAIVITKISPVRRLGLNDGGLSRKHIIEGCDASLKRLGTDYIDLYEIHEFDAFTCLEVTLRTLDDLIRDGKIRYFGCSNFTGWQLMKSIAISERNGWEKFATLESRYSLVCRMLEYEVIPLCLDQKVAVLAYSPLQGGYITGKYRKGRSLPTGTRFQNLEDRSFPVIPENLFHIVEELDKIAANHNATIPQAAMNYCLQKPGICSVIIGVRNLEQLLDNLKTTNWEMSADEVLSLDKLSEPLHAYPYYTWDPEEGIYVKH